MQDASKQNPAFRIPATVVLLSLALAGCVAERAKSQADHTGSAERRRIVIMAPAAAEMLEALDALDRVVGIGDYVLGPAEIAGLPRIGAYNAPNVEQVLALGADLLITASSRAGAAAHERLEALGVEVLALDTSTFEGVFASLAEVGRAVGARDAARALERRIRGELSVIRERAAGLPVRRVLFVVGRDPVYVAGPGSHVDEMIAIAGGSNVAHDALSSYQRVSMEAILERMPEVIIDTSDNRPDALRGRVNGDWEQWEFLPAVRQRRVYWVEPSRLVIPGIRLPEMTQLMGRLIHPEAFGDTADEDLGPEPES